MSSITDMIRRTGVGDHAGLDRLAGALFREGWGAGVDGSSGKRLHLGRLAWDPRQERPAMLWRGACQGAPGRTHALAELLYCHGFGETPERRWTYEMIHGAECRCELCTAVAIPVASVAGMTVGMTFDLSTVMGAYFGPCAVIDVDPVENTFMVPQPPPRLGKSPPWARRQVTGFDPARASRETKSLNRKRRSPRSLRRR